VATRLCREPRAAGGNLTGLSLMAPELVGKQLEILKEMVPKVTRVAVLGNPANAAPHHNCDTRRMQPGPLKVQFNPWKRARPRISTVPSRQ